MQEIINYIEDHLNEKIDLDSIADVHHYSKYYIHRQFTHQFGITIHTYIRRRQLTEAAKLLVFSKEPILEIALKSGYESQQSFTAIFKLMYKKSPAQFRRLHKYYPLQYRFICDKKQRNRQWTKNDIHTAKMSDIPFWMKLLHLVVDGYPMLNETRYEEQLRRFIEKKTSAYPERGRHDHWRVRILHESVSYRIYRNPSSIPKLRNPKIIYRNFAGSLLSK